MTEPEIRSSVALEQQRASNLRHARDINSYWRALGIEANARVVSRNLSVEVASGMTKTVRSAEIVSDLPRMMASALRFET